MRSGIALAVIGALLGLVGPLLLPFVTILEVEGPAIPGYKTLPGALGVGLCLAALATIALLLHRRRLQGLGAVLGGLALGELALMAWTWHDVWSLIPCEESGLALCEPDTGLLVAETLVRLDWGVGACLVGAALLFIGGVRVLQAQPEYGRHERFLRVRLGWQGCTLVECVAFRRHAISLGESDLATLRVPADGLETHLFLLPLAGDDEAWQVTAPPLGSLEIIGRDGLHALCPGESRQVRRGDCGMLRLDDDLFVSFDFMTADGDALGSAPDTAFDLMAPLTAPWH